jgi:hypothetical protein
MPDRSTPVITRANSYALRVTWISRSWLGLLPTLVYLEELAAFPSLLLWISGPQTGGRRARENCYSQ